jgi:DNA polymerase-1
MTAICDWCDLPFAEIWLVDVEYYPGLGLDHGGVEGDPSTPLCLVAHEMRSGRTIRLWQDELGRFPPYRLDNSALFISYMLTAEYGSAHLACGWGEPACALDAYVEFRHYVNDGSVQSGSREKGFYSLSGALRYFLEDELDLAHKEDMRARILRGPPFTEPEKRAVRDYCEDDVRGLRRLVPHLIPTIRSLPHALMRAKVQWALARQERRGVPIDGSLLAPARQHWYGMQVDLVAELDRPFGCYEIVDGKAHWRKERFAHLVRSRGMAWPTTESGAALNETDQTFREMAGLYPFIEPLRELRYSISKLKLNELAVGCDHRNRALLGGYGTKTGRNAPSNSKFIFGPAKWLRFFITPPPARVLVHRDYRQQEVRIAALLSGDAALLQACESGDVYLGIALQLGFLRESMNEPERRAVRSLFKTVVLGIQYGLGARSLAMRAGISLSEAAEILARLRARFRRFEDYARRVLDHAGLNLELTTPFGWTMHCPSGMNPRTLRNFPIQSTGAETLHVACILAERRGVEIVAPIHDAFLAEGNLADAEDLSTALDRLMRDASAVVLRGYELPTDVQIVRPDERYFDERGVAMWTKVKALLSRREQREIA